MFEPMSFLPTGTDPLSPLGGATDTISSQPTAISSAEATANTRVKFSTGNVITGGSGVLNPMNLGIIGIVAIIGIFIVKRL